MFWLGILLSGVGGLWLTVNAFRNSGALWGLCTLVIPLVAQIYGVRHREGNTVPLAISLAGLMLFWLGYDDYLAYMEAAQLLEAQLLETAP